MSGGIMSGWDFVLHPCPVYHVQNTLLELNIMNMFNSSVW